ncbi:hypothetical protein [Flavobacterium tructae]|uniref:hypothetical protein n=1 Tax=Flavobacterium tructae TaxID=1114873 RepID=UPI0035A8B2CD
MGFFKKIGKAIKKNVSFKNLVKIATPIMGAIPFVGGTLQNVSEGLQASHQAKKDAKAMKDEQERLIAEQAAESMKQQTLNYAGDNFGAIVDAGAQMVSKAVVNGAYSGTSKGLKEGAANVAADMADLSLSAWFKKHLNHILIAGAALGAIYLIRNKSSVRNSRRRFVRR